MIEGGIEETRRGGKGRKQLQNDLKEKRILELESGSATPHSVENSLEKKLWTCRKTDSGMNECYRVLFLWHLCSSYRCSQKSVRYFIYNILRLKDWFYFFPFYSCLQSLVYIFSPF